MAAGIVAALLYFRYNKPIVDHLLKQSASQLDRADCIPSRTTLVLRGSQHSLHMLPVLQLAYTAAYLANALRMALSSCTVKL